MRLRLPIPLARYLDRLDRRSAPGFAYLAFLATTPLTGVAGLAGLLPDTACRRRHLRPPFLESERATVMPTLNHTALDGQAESRPGHASSAGAPPLAQSTPEGPAQGPSPRSARAPATVADITRPSPATVGEYDHVAAAVYLMKHARSAALVVLGAQHGNPVGVITDADIARAAADGTDVEKTRIHDLLTARPAAIPAATSIRDAARTMVNEGCGSCRSPTAPTRSGSPTSPTSAPRSPGRPPRDRPAPRHRPRRP
jgi:CBS domain